eukprot:scaffold100686_cov63-Phaeocystis_antarctica.AAC.2
MIQYLIGVDLGRPPSSLSWNPPAPISGKAPARADFFPPLAMSCCSCFPSRAASSSCAAVKRL